MHLLHLCYKPVGIGNLRETFFLSHLGKVLIELTPFLAFAGCGFRKVFSCIANDSSRICGGNFNCATLKEREEHACMAEFLLSSLEEYCGDLLIALFLSLGSK